MKYLKLYEAFAKQASQYQTKKASSQTETDENEEDSSNSGNSGNFHGTIDISDIIKNQPPSSFPWDNKGDDGNGGGKTAVATPPNKCKPGWHFDKEKNECVPDSNPTEVKKLDPNKIAYAYLSDCPPGKVFNPDTNTCDEAPVIPAGKSRFKSIVEKLLSLLSANFDEFVEAYKIIGADVSIVLRNLLKSLKTTSMISIDSISIERCKYFIKQLLDSTSTKISMDEYMVQIMKKHLRSYDSDILLFEYYCGLILDM
jgi:hypothetical protein